MVTAVIEANTLKIPPTVGNLRRFRFQLRGAHNVLVAFRHATNAARLAGVREGNFAAKRGESFWLKDQPMGLAGFCLANHEDREGDLCSSGRTALPSEHPPR